MCISSQLPQEEPASTPRKPEESADPQSSEDRLELSQLPEGSPSKDGVKDGVKHSVEAEVHDQSSEHSNDEETHKLISQKAAS